MRSYIDKTTDKEILIDKWNTDDSKLNETASISFSKESDGYVVFMKLTKSCSIYHPPREWFNKSDIDMMKQIGIGPDEIIVQLEGPSLQTKVAISQNFCNEYYTIFQLPVSGYYNLKVYRIRKHYEASRCQNKFPKMIYEVFLDTWVQLDSYYPKPCVESLNGYWVSKWDRKTNVPINVRQRCEGKGEKRGLRLTTNFLVSNDYGKERCAKDIELYSWNRKICRPDYNEQTEIYGEEINQHRANLTDTRPKGNSFLGKKILFVGDSHMRGLADLFLYHVCEFQIPHLTWNQSYLNLDEGHNQPRASYLQIPLLQKSASAFLNNCNLPKSDPKCILFNQGCMGLTFAYMGAMYCQSRIAQYAAGFDYVIVNCGHHPAATSHYTYEFFRNSVTNMVTNFKRFNIESQTKLFWLQNTAQPLRQDDFTFYFKDWRTYHRLILFDAIAQSVFYKEHLDIKVLPAFHSTLALFDKMCDCGHYAISAKIPQLLGLLDAIYNT